MGKSSRSGGDSSSMNGEGTGKKRKIEEAPDSNRQKHDDVVRHNASLDKLAKQVIDQHVDDLDKQVQRMTFALDGVRTMEQFVNALEEDTSMSQRAEADEAKAWQNVDRQEKRSEQLQRRGPKITGIIEEIDRMKR